MKAILRKSNRYKHLIGGFIIGIIINSVFDGIIATSAVGGALEFKDKSWGGKWDWIDLLFTILGGVLGQLVRQLLNFFIFKQISWI